ncbi:hypothetical protein [Streptomyces sp. NPDC091268]|uniref:hypothetical protein n=1 Tax=Streptomyces sp. NPDC091268 TaxID=3365979 RepID=UPI00381FF83D
MNPDWRGAAGAVSVQNTTTTVTGGTFNAPVLQGRDHTATFNAEPRRPGPGGQGRVTRTW